MYQFIRHTSFDRLLFVAKTPTMLFDVLLATGQLPNSKSQSVFTEKIRHFQDLVGVAIGLFTKKFISRTIFFFLTKSETVFFVNN